MNNPVSAFVEVHVDIPGSDEATVNSTYVTVSVLSTSFFENYTKNNVIKVINVTFNKHCQLSGKKC